MSLLCLCYRTTLRFDFLHLSSLVCGLYVKLQVTNQKKLNLSPSLFTSACRLVFYLYVWAVENLEISVFCVSEIRALRTEHKRVKKIKHCCSET